MVKGQPTGSGDQRKVHRATTHYKSLLLTEAMRTCSPICCLGRCCLALGTEKRTVLTNGGRAARTHAFLLNVTHALVQILRNSGSSQTCGGTPLSKLMGLMEALVEEKKNKKKDTNHF